MYNQGIYKRCLWQTNTQTVGQADGQTDINARKNVILVEIKSINKEYVENKNMEILCTHSIT